MRITVQSVIVAMTVLASVAHGQSRIDAISTQFRWLGPNDKIVVERYDAIRRCEMSPATCPAPTLAA